MSKFILLSIILTTTAFSTSKTMASGPNTVSCTTCQSETDFWTYGAGHIEDNYGGAFAAFTSNDRIIVRNSSGASYMIDVDPVTATACFIWCFSCDQRGKWQVSFQNLNGGSAKSVETFLHVLRTNYQRLKTRESQAGWNWSQIDNTLNKAEGFYNSGNWSEIAQRRGQSSWYSPFPGEDIPWDDCSSCYAEHENP